MSQHPLNLALRFMLELAALTSMGIWGWSLSENWIRLVFAFGIPVSFAAIWGIFAVANDPSRSGKAPIPVNGKIRLLYELIFFSAAAWCLFDIDLPIAGIFFSAIFIIHYSTSTDRIKWLFKH